MSVKIRLTRMGRKKRPFYRIVVTDSRVPRDGRYIENIGFYNPITDPPEIQVEAERATYWLDQGAIPSDTVRSILQRQGIMFKRHLDKKGLDEAQVEVELKKWEVLQLDRDRRQEAVKEEAQKAKVKAREEVVEPEPAAIEEGAPAETAPVVEAAPEASAETTADPKEETAPAESAPAVEATPVASAETALAPEEETTPVEPAEMPQTEATENAPEASESALQEGEKKEEDKA